MHIAIWLSGLYDPVTNDFLPPAQLRWYVARIFLTPVVFLATFRLAMKYANRPA
jgi:hypothetical protein